jgi:hypothetical protein
VVVIIQANADEFADFRYRHAKAGIAAHHRQVFVRDLGQLAQYLVRQLFGTDVIDHAGQVAQLAFIINQTGFFFAGTAVTNQFHTLPST